ncbi:MAG: cytochrome c [Aquamicrobium sp.]|uniref:c-type cytochrome n=1 Tax=Mesorhizobium sp. Pch-S TaxID=2082387 RepID=UPI0010126526|nr:cytochrome c [Mesorhizobium sp. Pch-S]MBR2691301.1 cytochrome c [Aquamicrobium sp.]QAZ42258.1 cytochrome C biogenesis protein CcsB [Mesorhizobium sp. Pch-S]
MAEAIPAKAHGGSASGIVLRQGAATGFAVALAMLVTGSALADDAALFTQTCGACHGKGGVGIPGMAPPLAGADWAKGGKPDSRTYVPTVILNGLSGKLTAAGRTYQSVMPAQKQRKDDEIATLANYVLATLNTAPADFKPLTAADVTALRANKVDHKALLGTRSQLVQ